MDVQHFTSPISYRFDSSDHPVSRIARLATTLGAALVLCLCVIVAIRGWLGAFQAPGSSLWLVLTAVTAELLASAFRIIWRRLHRHATPRSALLARLVVPSICVICVAIAMSMTGANGWVVGSLWLVFAGGEVAWWYPEMRALRDRGSERIGAVVIDFEVPEAVQDNDAHIDEREEFAPNVIQKITRSRNNDGVEVISGVVRAEFAPGERTHNLHLAFCPPLAYEPAVITHQLDGSPLTIKVGQSEIFGTRIELRLTEAVGPTDSATIYFEVHPR